MSRRKPWPKKFNPKARARAKWEFFWRLMADTELSASAKCVATALLFKRDNNKTGRCDPAFETIGEDIGRDRRNVIRSIGELKDRGWITVQSTKGGRAKNGDANTNRYHFDLPLGEKRTKGDSDATVNGDTGNSVKNARNGDICAPQTIHEPWMDGDGAPGASAPPARSPELEQAFEHFWQAWQRPYNDDRDEMLAAFMEACAGDDVDAIMASAAEWLSAKANEPQFLPEPVKWLRGGWKSAPPPRKPAARRGGKESLVDIVLAYGGV
jgi:hypothetical protein